MRVSPLACVQSGRSINVPALPAILLKSRAFEKVLTEVYSTLQARVVKLHLCAGVCCKLQLASHAWPLPGCSVDATLQRAVTMVTHGRKTAHPVNLCCASVALPRHSGSSRWAAAPWWAIPLSTCPVHPLQGHRGSSRRLQRCGGHGLLVVQLHPAALDAVGDVPRGRHGRRGRK